MTGAAAILAMIDAFLGSNMAKGFLALLKQNPDFTDEQKARLDSDYVDLVARKTRLEEEIAAQKQT